MSKRTWLIGGGVLGIVILAAGVWFLFLNDDAPDEVSNTAANEDLDAVLADADPAEEPVSVVETAPEEPNPDPVDDPVDVAEPGDGSFDGTIDGNWVVDDEIGDFDFDTASGSFAGFRVAEELAVVGDTTAVGRSGDVVGSVTIAGGVLTGAEITVDMTTIVSNESRREGAIQRAIGAADFSTATFVFTDSVDVSALEVGGAASTFSVEGNLTVKGVTQPVTFEIEANVRDDGFAIITGSAELVWEDFGVTPPSAAVVVSVADEGIVEFQLVAEQG